MIIWVFHVIVWFILSSKNLKMRPRVFKASLSKDRASIRSAAGKNLTAFDEATARSNVFHHLSFSATMPAVYWDCLKMRQLTQELTSVQITLKLSVFSEFFGPRRKIIMWKKVWKSEKFSWNGAWLHNNLLLP